MRKILVLLLLFPNLAALSQEKGNSYADSLITEIKKKVNYLEITQPVSFYNFRLGLRDSIKSMAAEAQSIYEPALKASEVDTEAQVDLLEKTALSLHFQIQDFSYQDSLPELYHKSLQLMELAIRQEKSRGISRRLAQLYLTSANLAAPHFYFAWVSPIGTKAEDRSFQYLDLAARAYFEIGNPQAAINCWRAVGNRSLKSSLRLLDLSIEVEGDSSLQIASDISDLYHMHYYSEVERDERESLQKYGKLGLKIYGYHQLNDYLQGTRLRLMRDMGHYQYHQLNDIGGALELYLLAQELEMALKKKLYYTCFFIAALQMEKKDFEEAEKQYNLAKLDVRLSPTDGERVWFGLCMIKFLQGDHKGAKDLWKERISDSEIMNGISGYSAYFKESSRAELKQNALELVDLVNAKNAKRIIEDGWN